MPTDDQALQFAVMLQAGLPASEAIRYFTESDDPAELRTMTDRWSRSRAVARALTKLMKKPWQDMSLDERCRNALDLHYSQLAYLLRSSHYGEVGQADKAKLDTARQAIESKLAGMAGKTDALSRFFDDINTGRLKLGPAALMPKLD